MIRQKNYFMRNPGGENEGGSIIGSNNDRKIVDEKSSDMKEEDKEKHSFFEKVQDALQEWSNDDQHDQQIDDSRP